MQKSMSPEWLERANRLALVSRLLSSTVHDVNNALQVIAGSVELLQMSPPATEAIGRRITAIDTQTKRATRLLQELTEFVRDARETSERLDLKALAEFVAASRHYAFTKLRITGSVDGDAVFVSANPKHVRQIVLNLVINAEDAHSQTITIRTGANGAFGTLAIEDDAVPGEEKADGAASLGIGLEVSTWLAERNGGALTREQMARGSRATLSLPLAL